jgi:hypothetical protein
MDWEVLSRTRTASSRWGLDGSGSVLHHLFQNEHVLGVTLASQRSESTESLRSIAFKALRHVDQLAGDQHLQVPTEIPVRQTTELFQIPEPQSFRVDCKRRQHAQTRPFMNDTVKTRVGVGGLTSLAGLRVAH